MWSFALGYDSISLYVHKTLADLTLLVGCFRIFDIARHFHFSFFGILSQLPWFAVLWRPHMGSASVAYFENRQGGQPQEGARSKGRHRCLGRFCLPFLGSWSFFRNTCHENFPLTFFRALYPETTFSIRVGGRLGRQEGSDMSQCPP